MLVAGVTGGASLIESAKINRISTEFRDYEQALYAFYSLYNRLPGDANNDGLIGYQSNEVYSANYFPSPYNSDSNEYGIPTAISGPFVDLYLAKVIDFEPKNTSNTNFTSNSAINNYQATPFSTGYKNAIYNYRAVNFGKKQNYFLSCNKYGVGIALRTIYIDSNKNFKYIAEKIDHKFDDGIFNQGKYRTYCDGDNEADAGYVDYVNSNKCSEITYITDL